MNKKWTYFLLILVFIGVVGAVFLSKQKDDATNLTTNTITKETIVNNEPVDDSVGSDTNEVSDDSRYVEYSNESYDGASDKRRILFFYASWCPTCRVADPNIRQNVSQIPKDVVVLRVNYNDPETDEDEMKLAQKYNITYQHTFVQVDSQGNEVAKWNGGQIEEILSNIK